MRMMKIMIIKAKNKMLRIIDKKICQLRYMKAKNQHIIKTIKGKSPNTCKVLKSKIITRLAPIK